MLFFFGWPRGMHLNINGYDVGDSPIPIVYRNLNIPDDEPLEVNDIFPNLIIIGEIYGTEESFVGSGGDPLNPYDGNKEGNLYTLAYMKVVARLTSYVHYHEEMKVALSSQN